MGVGLARFLGVPLSRVITACVLLVLAELPIYWSLHPKMSGLPLSSWPWLAFAISAGSGAILGATIAVVQVRGLRPRLTRPPGSRSRHWLAFAFSKKTMERVIEQEIIDLQEEWLEAMLAGRRVKAAWVQVRGYVRLAEVVLMQLPLSLVRRMYDAWTAVK